MAREDNERTSDRHQENQLSQEAEVRPNQRVPEPLREADRGPGQMPHTIKMDTPTSHR